MFHLLGMLRASFVEWIVVMLVCVCNCTTDLIGNGLARPLLAADSAGASAPPVHELPLNLLSVLGTEVDIGQFLR